MSDHRRQRPLGGDQQEDPQMSREFVPCPLSHRALFASISPVTTTFVVNHRELHTPDSLYPDNSRIPSSDLVLPTCECRAIGRHSKLLYTVYSHLPILPYAALPQFQPQLKTPPRAPQMTWVRYVELLGISVMALSTSDLVLSTSCVALRYRITSNATRCPQHPVPATPRHLLALDYHDSQSWDLAY